MDCKTEAQSEIPDLIGQFYLTFSADGHLEFQGKIIGSLGLGYYQSQIFSALNGEPTICLIRHLGDMAGWKFYLSEDRWHEACNVFAKVRK